MTLLQKYFLGLIPMDNFAPVLIPTLNRNVHFKRCVDSLSVCTNAIETELYIALDYPLNSFHHDGYNKILNFIEGITGFKQVHLIKRKVNYGSQKNYLDAINLIFKKYDRCIFSEDDNYFSPNFLDYINKGLHKYKDRNDIFAICGYNFPINMPTSYNKKIYLWRGLSAWGYGIWRDRWEKIRFDVDSDSSVTRVRSFLSDTKNIHKLEQVAGHYFPTVLKMVNTQFNIIEPLVVMYLVKNELLCVFPTISKVRNYGHDGSGEHCNAIKYDMFSRQRIDVSNKFEYDEFVEIKDENIYRELKKHFKRSWKADIKTLLMYITFIIKRWSH